MANARYFTCQTEFSFKAQNVWRLALEECDLYRLVVVMIVTVEPPNKGHFGRRAFVLFSEVVLWWEVRANMQFIAP